MYSNELFQHEATIGNKYTKIIEAYLQQHGIECTATPLTFATNKQEIKHYANEQDITFTHMPGCIETKSRRLNFTNNPNTYPHPTAYTDTVYGWNQKHPKPLATILISQTTHQMLVIPTSTQPTWKTTTNYDRIRHITETWYTVNKNQLQPIEQLTTWLQHRQNHYKNKTPAQN